MSYAQEDRLRYIAELAREYANICDDREHRDRRKTIVAEAARFTAMEAVYFAQQVASWTRHGYICDRLVVLANRISTVSPWIACSERLPDADPTTDYVGFSDSLTVLATDGKGVFTAYFRRWESPWDSDRWIMVGRDGYKLDGITHWQPLPKLPE